jgi:hypothetical protein
MPTPDDKSVIVACAAANQLVFFDPLTGQEQKRIRDISDPYQLGYSPNASGSSPPRCASTGSTSTTRVDFRLKARLPAHRRPLAHGFRRCQPVRLRDPAGLERVMAISLPTQKIAWVMPVAATPAGIVMAPDNRHLLVASMGEGVVEVIEWRFRKSVKKVATAAAAQSAAEGRRSPFLRLQPHRRRQHLAARHADHDVVEKVRRARRPRRHDGPRRRQGAVGHGPLCPQGAGRRPDHEEAEGVDPGRQFAARRLLPQPRRVSDERLHPDPPWPRAWP